MNLDELISNIKILSKDDNTISTFLSIIEDWKINNKTVSELNYCIDKFRDGFFPKKDEIHLIKIGMLLHNFQKEIISSINGMTINERIYAFSLFDRFELCKKNSKEEDIYQKLLVQK